MGEPSFILKPFWLVRWLFVSLEAQLPEIHIYKLHWWIINAATYKYYSVGIVKASMVQYVESYNSKIII